MLKQQGFTLIELMVVVAIIGVLAVIGLPRYADYVTRAQLSEVMTFLGAQKSAVAEYHANHGRLPRSNEETGIAAPNEIRGRYVKSVTVTPEGLIVAEIQGSNVAAEIQGKKITLEPLINPQIGIYNWRCMSRGEHALDPKWLPRSCEQ